MLNILKRERNPFDLFKINNNSHKLYIYLEYISIDPMYLREEIIQSSP